MFKGTYVALVTPFNEQYEVDFPALRALVEWHIESRTDGIVLCGSTGESPTLSHEEKLQIFKEGVLAAKGRIPIVAGTGSYDTRATLALTKEAREIGADAALVTVPYYNRPSPEGCFQHFQEVAKADLPMIVYHHPFRTGVKLPSKALARIAEIDNVAAVKDSSADLDLIVDLMREVDKPVFSGDDTLTVPFMSVGAVGVISVAANVIPREWKLLTTLLSVDEFDEGRELFYKMYPLVKALFAETNPQPLKFAMEAIGKCSGRVRLPLLEVQEATKKQILAALEETRVTTPALN